VRDLLAGPRVAVSPTAGCFSAALPLTPRRWAVVGEAPRSLPCGPTGSGRGAVAAVPSPS